LGRYGWCYAWIIALAWLSGTGAADADEINIAAASNFMDAIKSLAARFETGTSDKVTLIFGSTGKHFAQIKNGAPFDAFFAADGERPKLLEEEGFAVSGSRFTYAVGKIVVWSPRQGYVDPAGKVLNQEFRYLAIANPRLAPYGKAAQEVLSASGLWGTLQGRIVQGEDIEQTFQFVESGNAELGFVAYSQIRRPNHSIPGSYWEVPQSLYSPIEQQAVLLRDKDAARAFLAFAKSEEGRTIIQSFGYDLP
jgi:molybdate transport system substrate-binding protein